MVYTSTIEYITVPVSTEKNNCDGEEYWQMGLTDSLANDCGSTPPPTTTTTTTNVSLLDVNILTLTRNRNTV